MGEARIKLERQKKIQAEQSAQIDQTIQHLRQELQQSKEKLLIAMKKRNLRPWLEEVNKTMFEAEVPANPFLTTGSHPSALEQDLEEAYAELGISPDSKTRK